MSNRRTAIALIAFMLVPLLTRAQDGYCWNADPTFDIEGRASASFDWRIADGFHLEIQEEGRFCDSFTTFEKSYTTVGLSYKILPFLKVGASYSYILALKDGEEGTDAFWRTRSRFSGDITGTVHAGYLKFSLRERFQYTHPNYDVNVYQRPENLMALRSRLKVSYELPGKPLEPYVSAELRHQLNAVDPESLSTRKISSTNPATVSYDKVYMDRVRASVGVEWRLDKRNWLDFYLMGQHFTGMEIDTNAEGKLKKFNPATGTGGVQTRSDWVFSIGVAYTFGI